MFIVLFFLFYSFYSNFVHLITFHDKYVYRDDQVGRNTYGKGIVINWTLAYLYVHDCKVFTIECQ